MKAIIFDFDGVIVESVGVKRDAFAKLFVDYPDQLEEIVEHHMINGGLSRYKKFEYIYREILKEELTEEKSNELGRQFTANGYEAVLKAPYVKGAIEFIKQYKDDLLLFIASGTPHEEMVQIVNEKDLQSFFKAVYGSPKSKEDIIREILAQNDFKTNEVLFIGDAITDLNGAKAAGVKFIGRVHESFESPFKDVDPQDLIQDLTELPDIVEREGNKGNG